MPIPKGICIRKRGVPSYKVTDGQGGLGENGEKGGALVRSAKGRRFGAAVRPTKLQISG